MVDGLVFDIISFDDFHFLNNMFKKVSGHQLEAIKVV